MDEQRETECLNGQPCGICMLFPGNGSQSFLFGMSVTDLCGVCKRRRDLVRHVPLVVREFLDANTVCWSCRNVLHNYVKKQWRLCWGSSPDRFLKVALCDMLLSHVLNPAITGYDSIDHAFSRKERSEQST